MITFAQKPGIFSYWITDHRYTKLAGHIVLENLEVTGSGRFQSADLPGLWDLPFIKVFKDGDHWCALVGPDLQEGVAEFKPIAPERGGMDLYDQITDFGHEYRRAHPETKYADRFVYWLPHEIDLMAEQARRRAAVTRADRKAAP
jgi:hypothetical protein